MANLKYSDKHNMVAFLKKPNESVGFTEVVDFLKVASIDSKEYTITEVSVKSKLQLADATGIHNLSDAEIYAGLATLGPGGWDQFGSTVATALICLSSNRVYNFSKCFDGMESISPNFNKKLFEHGKGLCGDIVTLLPDMLEDASTDQGKRISQTAVPHPHLLIQYPSLSLPQSIHLLQFTTSVHHPHPPPIPTSLTTSFSPHRVTSLEKELKDTKQTLGNVVLKLVKKVKSLEKASKRKSKKVIMSASEGEEPEDQGRIIQDINDDSLVSLVRESMKEKSTDFVTPTKASGEAQEEEEISPTILEAAKTLRRARSMAKKINTELDVEDEINTGRFEINTGRVEINSGIKDVNTGSSKVDTSRTSISTSSIIHSPKKGQREGKAQMVEEDIQATHKTKEQIRQEEAGLEEAIRLQAQMDEEVAKQIHLDKMLAKRVQEEQELSEQQLKRKAEVQKAAQFYTEEDWDTIRAKLEANTEGNDEVVKEEEVEVPVKKIGMRRKQKARKGINIDKTAQDEFNKEREAYVKDQVKDTSSELEIGVDVIQTATKPPTIVNWKIIYQSNFSRDELVELYKLVIKKYGANRPEEMYDRVLWGDLKTMFDPPLSDDAIWSLPLQQKIINWRLRGDRIVAFENRMAFVHELKNVTGVSIVAKTVVFLKEMMEKEDSRDYHLESLENKAKQRALEMESFVQKLMRDELRYKVDLSDWTDVLAYFCQEVADEDRRIAMKLNRLREEILIVCEKRRNFVDELMSIRGIVVVGKAAEFVKLIL
ncbi:hypothetical protein Tco_0654931 [Tanacetum coccineum]|uniref:Uncharacterized protein n=1 Tax=Tanacetum coccineum TaxID=301880 RepID=A0ABQ4X4W3_9ASTR